MTIKPYYCIGIDPGANGAICILPRQYKDIQIFAFKNYSLRSLSLILDEYLKQSIDIFVEKSGLHPRNGKQSYYASGRNLGQIEGLLAKFDYTLVSPVKWMNALDCRTKGDKNITKVLAESFFGRYIKITHTNADAALIAHYGFTLYGHEVRCRPKRRPLRK